MTAHCVFAITVMDNSTKSSCRVKYPQKKLAARRSFRPSSSHRKHGCLEPHRKHGCLEPEAWVSGALWSPWVSGAPQKARRARPGTGSRLRLTGSMGVWSPRKHGCLEPPGSMGVWSPGCLEPPEAWVSGALWSPRKHGCLEPFSSHRKHGCLEPSGAPEAWVSGALGVWSPGCLEPGCLEPLGVWSRSVWDQVSGALWSPLSGSRA